MEKQVENLSLEAKNEKPKEVILGYVLVQNAIIKNYH